MVHFLDHYDIQEIEYMQRNCVFLHFGCECSPFLKLCTRNICFPGKSSSSVNLNLYRRLFQEEGSIRCLIIR